MASMNNLNLNKPSVSVLMCAHNEEDLIEESLRSVLSEREVDFELVVVDDRSTDGTPKILELLANADSRLKIITRVDSIDQENPESGKYYAKDNGHGGQTDALNLGLKFCSGKYIARLDADDISMPHRLKKQLAFMEENPAVDFLGASAFRINHLGKVFGRYHSKPLSHVEIVNKIRSFEAYAPHSSWFVKRKLYEKLNGYDQFGFRAEDLDFLLRASELAEVKFAFIGEPLICLRMHGGSLSYTASSVPTGYAISAVVRHLLRSYGYKDIDSIRGDILISVKNCMREKELGRKIASYNALRTSFICMKKGGYLAALINFTKSFFYSPKVALNYKILLREKNNVANEVYKNFIKESY